MDCAARSNCARRHESVRNLERLRGHGRGYRSVGAMVEPQLGLHRVELREPVEYTRSRPADPHSTTVATEAGHVIQGAQWIEAGDSGDGDIWEMWTYDETADVASYFTMNIGTGSSNPPVDTAYLGILEVHGLAACDGLPKHLGR